jgi:hypothetical protein
LSPLGGVTFLLTTENGPASSAACVFELGQCGGKGLVPIPEPLLRGLKIFRVEQEDTKGAGLWWLSRARFRGRGCHQRVNAREAEYSDGSDGGEWPSHSDPPCFSSLSN